jgi:hypothetical protein
MAIERISKERSLQISVDTANFAALSGLGPHVVYENRHGSHGCVSLDFWEENHGKTLKHSNGYVYELFAFVPVYIVFAD